MTNYDALVSAATILAETNPETAEKLQNMADTLQRRAERAKVRKANTPAKPSKTHIANVEFFDEHIMSIVEEHGVVTSSEVAEYFEDMKTAKVGAILRAAEKEGRVISFDTTKSGPKFYALDEQARDEYLANVAALKNMGDDEDEQEPDSE